MFRPLMLAIFRLYMNLSSSYTACVEWFLGCGEGVILYGAEISFVSVVGAWSGTLIISYPFLNFSAYPQWINTMICVKTLKNCKNSATTTLIPRIN